MSGAGGGPLKLSVCDISRCEGRCCYDGVYLQPAEEEFLRELVARVPALAATLPAGFIVDGWWDGEFLGRKTATRPVDYRAADFPAHFARTRCVFSDAMGYCELEKLARSRGQHPWTFKPTTCWMFPLQDENGVPVEPVRGPADDPYVSTDYAGYASCVSCGRHDPAGKPWKQALAREIAYLEAAPQLPLLGAPGHTVEELLADKKTPRETAGSFSLFKRLSLDQSTGHQKFRRVVRLDHWSGRCCGPGVVSPTYRTAVHLTKRGIRLPCPP